MSSGVLITPDHPQRVNHFVHVCVREGSSKSYWVVFSLWCLTAYLADVVFGALMPVQVHFQHLIVNLPLLQGFKQNTHKTWCKCRLLTIKLIFKLKALSVSNLLLMLCCPLSWTYIDRSAVTATSHKSKSHD